MRRPLFGPAVLSLFVVMGSLLWGGTAALATSTVSNLAVQVGGTVDGAPESVSFSGLAQIRSVVVTDPDFGTAPAEVVSINFRNLSATGLTTKTKYVTAAESDVTRVFVPSDVVELTFPFYPNTPDGYLSARTAVATFTLTFNTKDGTLSKASGSISTPNFTVTP